MRVPLLVLAAAQFGAAILAQAPPPPAGTIGSSVLALTHVTVIDVATGAERRDQTVLISGGRIAAVSPARAARLPAGALIVNLRGKWMVPGLIDAHVHLTNAVPERALRELLAAGVTTVRDVGANAPDTGSYAVGAGQVERIAELAGRVERGELTGPRVRYCGPGFTSAARAPSNAIRLAVGDTTDTTVARSVDYLAAAGASCIKIYSGTRAAHVRALARAARARGLPLIGHSLWEVPISEQLSWGWSEIEHQWVQPDELLSPGAAERMPKQPFARLFVGWALFNPMEPRARETARRIAAAGLAWTPTNVGNESLSVPWMWGPITYGADSMDQGRIRAALLPGATAAPSAADSSAAITRVMTEFALRWTRLLHEAGVPLVAGSDAPIDTVGGRFAVPFGRGLHRELELLVDAGLSPIEALRAATLNAARYIGVGESVGVITPGMLADFVILDADPLRDVRNIGRIHVVSVGGRLLSRATLDSMVARAR